MSVMDALEAVYKADPATAESMIDDIVLDTLTDLALDNAELLNKSAAAYVSQRVVVAKRALLRQYATDVANGFYPSDEVHKAAEWLAGIEAFTIDTLVSKATAVWDLQDENKHRRDSRGRFSRGVNQNRRRDPTQYQNIQQVAHPVRNKIRAEGGARTLADPSERDKVERVQAQYEQADEILREFGGAFSHSERQKMTALIQVQSDDGTIKTFGAPLSDAAHGMPDSLYNSQGGIGIDDKIISIEIDAQGDAPDDLKTKVNRFNTLGAMGGQQMATLGSMDEKQRGALTSALMPRGPEQGKLSSLFGRFKSGAGVLDATGHDKMAGMARFMGEWGPEAEKVMDPRVRQAAYRYRGTEKEPDIDLMRVMNSPQMSNVERAAREEGDGPMTEALLSQPDIAAVGRTGRGDRPMEMGPLEGSLKANLRRAAIEEEPFTEDQLNMRVRSDIAAMHLLKQIPANRMIGDLSRKSGNILPSQGVLIDADGDVVSQAVGFGDDTYLPFDYKNIKGRLRGGQYVRTRVQGGLTGEDIAAAVGNGARMATVVSSSGVHSIEFDPNLRGARAGSDKARSMSRRYVQILDAVENSGLYTQDISGPEKAKLRNQAAEIAGTRTGDDYDSAYKRLEEQARAAATSLSEEETEALMEQATTTVDSQRTGSSQQRQRMINDVYTELEEKASSEKASRLRLNAEGYQVALQTLQQQFPYFIRNVSYEPLAGTKGDPGFLDSRGQRPEAGVVRQRLKGEDKGYMRPGGIRAHTVRGGFYRTDKPEIGADGASGLKKPLSGDRFQASQPKPEGPAGGGDGGAGGAPPAQGLSGPMGGPAGGLQEMAAGYKAAAQVERTKALTELTNTFGALSAQRVNLANSPAGGPWEGVKDLDNIQIATWFMSQQNPAAVLANPEQAARVTAALTDRASVKQAFTNALRSSTGQDYFEGKNTFGPAGSPAKTADEAAEMVADLALKVADTDLITDPFVSARGVDGKGDPYHFGARPQVRTINGISTNNITSSPKLQAALKAADPKTVALARELGSTDGGVDYRSAAEVGTEVTARIKALRDMPKIIAAARNKKANAEHGGNTMGAQQYIGPNITPGENPIKFQETLAKIRGKAVNTDADLVAMGNEIPQPDVEANRLQDAWSLIAAGRTVAMIEGGGDVGGGPKDPSRPRGDQWVAKSLQVASTRPARPRLERVSKDSSPLAREISRRRLQGLQYVPTRVG